MFYSVYSIPRCYLKTTVLLEFLSDLRVHIRANIRPAANDQRNIFQVVFVKGFQTYQLEQPRVISYQHQGSKFSHWFLFEIGE